MEQEGYLQEFNWLGRVRGGNGPNILLIFIPVPASTSFSQAEKSTPNSKERKAINKANFLSDKTTSPRS